MKTGLSAWFPWGDQAPAHTRRIPGVYPIWLVLTPGCPGGSLAVGGVWGPSWVHLGISSRTFWAGVSRRGHIIWYHIIQYGIILYNMVSYYTIWYHIVRYDIILQGGKKRIATKHVVGKKRIATKHPTTIPGGRVRTPGPNICIDIFIHTKI